MLLLGRIKKFLQFVNRSKLNRQVRVAANLLGCHVEDVAYKLRLDIHSQCVLALIDDHALCVAFVHVGFEVRIVGLLAAACTSCNRVSTT